MDFNLDIQNYLLLFSASVNLTLSFFVYFSGKKRRVNLFYSSLVFAVTLWTFGLFMYRGVNTTDLAIFWTKIYYIASGITPLALLYFALAFPDGKIRIKNLIKILILIIGVLFIISPLLHNFIVTNVIVHREIENEIFFGRGLYIWGGYLFIYFLAAFSILIKKYIQSQGIIKLQLRYIIFGSIISTIIAFISNHVLPLFLHNPNYAWLGPTNTIIMVAFIAYAIVKYRLMNIRLVVSRSILYGVLVGAVASFFALAVFLAGQYLGATTRGGKIVSYLISSAVVVIFLEPVKRTWAKFTDAIFYKGKIDYQQVLRQASEIIAREIDLETLLEKLNQMLTKEIKLKNSAMFIWADDDFQLISKVGREKENINFTPEIVSYFQTHHGLLITEELIKKSSELPTEDQKENQAVIQNLEANKIEMVVPIVEQDKLNALFVFGNKLSGDIFSNEDIEFFTVLAPQIATAIEKSKLYEEVQKLNEKLQAKVEERTKSLRQANLDLEQRNKFLTTMQAVNNMISRTFDLNKVNQLLAGSINTQLGYIGGILSFVDEEHKVLHVGALTRNAQTEPAIKMLSEDIHNYESKLEYDYNLGAKTVLTGRINFSSQMTDFFSPPVEKETIIKIQELLKVKTIVSVPIFVEDKIVGVIYYLLAVEREKISALDIEMMTAFTNQVGIVSRNLKLYENLQKVNKEIYEANIHLRALDKAKSEFLSIASHQLRTPISAVKGYLSMILEGDFGPVNAAIRKVINDVYESSARLARVINVFLNVSRIEAGRLKIEKNPMQINDMIESVIAELINSAKQKGLELVYDKPKEKVPMIMADEDKLREVVLNLVDNAIKYTPQGSITISVKFDAKELTFISKDTGIGIHPHETRTLFKKFVRGDGVAQIHTGGSGLGLFIAQKIIKEHGGKIWVESEGKGEGSTFQFTIPLATKEEIRHFKNRKDESFSAKASSSAKASEDRSDDGENK